MIKRIFLGLLAIQVLALTGAKAYQVNFDLQADLLKTSTGTPMPTSGLYLLVASTTNATFGALSNNAPLTLGSFVNSDDQIIARGNLMTADNTPGVLAVSLTLNTSDFSTELSGGDRLILYWLPTLTLASTTLSTGNTYGLFRTDTTQDNTQAWTLPATVISNYRLYFPTTDANTYGPGTHLPAEGRANLIVVPEPSTYLLGFLGSVGLVLVARQRRSASAV